MKKIISVLYITATIFACIPQQVKAAPDHRATALVVVGSLVALAGVHTLCKEGKSTSHNIGRIITGLALVSLGGATVLFSKDIVREYDNQVLNLRWERFKKDLGNWISN